MARASKAPEQASDGASFPDSPPPPSPEDFIGQPFDPGLPVSPVIKSHPAMWHWDAADRAAEILARQDGVFLTTRTGTLVRVDDRPGFTTRIEDLTPTRVVDQLGRAQVRFVEGDPNGDRGTYVLPPAALVNTIIERRNPRAGWRPLAGLAPGPYMLSDGSVTMASGYDPDTKLWLPDVSTASLGAKLFENGYDKATACRGVAHLVSELSEFCFAEPALDKAVWLAYLFTQLTRPAYSTCPLFLFGARKPRSGKDLLFMLAEIVASGRQARHIPADCDKTELTKLIGTAIKGGATPLILGDATQIGHGLIYQMVTEPDVAMLRVLGESEEIPVPPCMILGATANQISFANTDLFGRIVALQLDPDTARPEDRVFSKEQDQLVAWFYENRPKLLSVAFNILRGFLRARAEDPACVAPGIRCGSFPGWARLVRDCLLWCDLPDVLLTQARARREIDVPGVSGIAMFMQAFFDLWGFNAQRTTGEIVKVGKAAQATPRDLLLGASILSADELTYRHEQLSAALEQLMPTKWHPAILKPLLDKAIGAQEIQIKGRTTTVRFNAGKHNNQAQFFLTPGKV